MTTDVSTRIINSSFSPAALSRGNVDIAGLLANAHHKLGSHFIATENWSDAETHLIRSSELLESLVVSSPVHSPFQIELAQVRSDLSDFFRGRDQPQRSREVLELAIKEYSAFRETRTRLRPPVSLLIDLYDQLAQVLTQLGMSRQATEAATTAAELRESKK